MWKQTEIRVRGILGFIEKGVTPFGTGAEVDRPREHLGRRVYLVIPRD